MGRIGVFAFFWIFVTGCQLMPTDYSEHSEGQWSSKVLVKDKVQSKSYIVNVDIQAVRDKKLRMDVTAALGMPVAALVLDDEEVKYILFRQKRYYEGQASERVLKPILSIPLNPRLLFNILFDVPIADKNWSCSKGKDGFLTECSSSSEGLKVTWKDRKGRKKAIFIEHEKAELQMNISSFKPRAEDVFTLKAPESFQKYRIR